jgi:lysophospholipase L1-like esterase
MPTNPVVALVSLVTALGCSGPFPWAKPPPRSADFSLRVRTSLAASDSGAFGFLLQDPAAVATPGAEGHAYEIRAVWTVTAEELRRDGAFATVSGASALAPNGRGATADLGEAAAGEGQAPGLIRFLSVTDLGGADAAKVVCLGDSITYGLPFASEPYPARLQGLGSRRVVLQQGIPGETTKQLRDRWTRRLRALRPDTLVVQGGVNDLHEDASATAIYANLAAIFDEARTDGARVVAVTVLPFGGDAAWTPARQEQAELLNDLLRRTAGVAVVDAYAAMSERGDPRRLRASYDAGDGLHPNDAGAALLAALVAGAIP